MWTLQPPKDINHQEIIDVALTYKNGDAKYTLTNDEKNAISNICIQYDGLKGKEHDDLKGEEALRVASRTAMHDAYNEVQIKGRLSDYRSKLLFSALRCPCCGISAADELDHYLPRSQFNALSLYSNNLIPMCHQCNNKKRTHHSDTDERFLHAYFDNVPSNERFFIADTSITNGALIVNFSAIKTPGITDEVLSMISFQINLVRLNARLKKEINIFLTAFIDVIEMTYDVQESSDDVKKLLNGAERTFTNKFGLNDWRSALLNSLSNNDRFCGGGVRIVFEK
ncbi:HNH endonuclease signature motif containing protein [Aeromonas popoffii]|uniref:HNH endonuclease n=1 Tax=Aeromonas popoffii TaxID=70856 RepID=UPI0030D358B6